MEDPLEEEPVGAAGAARVDLVDAPRGPGVDGRVHVAEGPLVGRELPVRVHVPLAREQQELLLGEVGVDEGERDAVEGEVPRRVPGVLPLVGHRDHVGVEEVRPLGVPALRRARREARARPGPPSASGRRRTRSTASSGGARRRPGAGRSARRRRAPRAGAPRRTRPPRRGGARRPRRSRRRRRRPPGAGSSGEASARSTRPGPPRRRTRPRPSTRRDAGFTASRRPCTTSSWKASFTYGLSFATPQSRSAFVSFSVKSSSGAPFREEPARAVERVLRGEDGRAGSPLRLAEARPPRVEPPAPGVAVPERREEVERRGPRPAVRRRHLHEEVLGGGLRVLDRDVPVARRRRSPVSDELELGLEAAPRAVPLDEPLVRVLRLHVLVEELHVRVRRRRVEVVVAAPSRPRRGSPRAR